MRARTASAACRSVGQVLAELQQGDQRQPPGRQARLTQLGEQVGKVRVGEDGAELVTQGEQRIALAERGLGDARRPLRHGLDRAGLEHGRPPADWTRRSIPAHLGSADFANGIHRDTVGEFAGLTETGIRGQSPCLRKPATRPEIGLIPSDAGANGRHAGYRRHPIRFRQQYRTSFLDREALLRHLRSRP
jgi:hypothetical protein